MLPGVPMLVFNFIPGRSVERNKKIRKIDLMNYRKL
jgi:hypothetical protein